jgi:thiol-disulfide isomerase/thioredoxin
LVKCKICGKRFETVTGLKEHYRAIHPKALFITPKQRLTRSVLVVLILILIVVSGVVGYLIYAQTIANRSTNNGIINKPISSTLFQEATNVSVSTLASIGYQQSSDVPPKQIPGSAAAQLVSPQDKPEILYIGAEWCPYCAAERWALVVALSKFGNFTNLKYMLSAANDGNISTLTFVNATYTSPYISFVSVEYQDRNRNPLQHVNPDQQDLWNSYTSNAEGIPFIYIDGQYYLTTSQFNPTSLSGLNWTQIASQLNYPQSTIAKNVDGAANQLIGTICLALQSRSWPEPKSLCDQSFANVSFSFAISEASLNSLVGNMNELTTTMDDVEINFQHLFL